MTSLLNESALANALKQCTTTEYCETIENELHKFFPIKLLTFTLIDLSKLQAKRIYSSNKDCYAIGGTKPIEANSWTQQVIIEQTPFVANRHRELANVFFDHALIEQLGLGSVINWPVVINRAVLGTINLLAQEHAYQAANLSILDSLLPWLAIPFLRHRN